LVPDSFQAGFVILKAGDSKNRNGGRLPIPEALAEGLAEWLANKPAGLRIFDGFAIAQKSGIVCTSAFSRNLKKDMAQARKVWLAQGGTKESDFLQYKDSAGQYADFHSMRVSAITWAVADGANPKLVQALARHSTITLTMDRYCKAPKGGELVEISNGLGEKLMGASNREGFIRPPICQNYVQTGDNQKIRLISNETIPAKVDPSKTARKQAFCGVLSRKKEKGPPGFEPGYNGFANRCLDSVNPIADKDLREGTTPIWPSICQTPPLGQPHSKDLQEVIEAWDTLPDAIKAGILAMVAASKPVELPPLEAVAVSRLNTWPRKTGANPKRIRR